jgi:hypothetical protein
MWASVPRRRCARATPGAGATRKLTQAAIAALGLSAAMVALTIALLIGFREGTGGPVSSGPTTRCAGHRRAGRAASDRGGLLPAGRCVAGDGAGPPARGAGHARADVLRGGELLAGRHARAYVFGFTLGWGATGIWWGMVLGLVLAGGLLILAVLDGACAEDRRDLAARLALRRCESYPDAGLRPGEGSHVFRFLSAIVVACLALPALRRTCRPCARRAGWSSPRMAPCPGR